MAVARRVIPFGVSKIVYTSRSEKSGIHGIVVVVFLFFVKKCFEVLQISPPFLFGGQRSVSNFEKGEGED